MELGRSARPSTMLMSASLVARPAADHNIAWRVRQALKLALLWQITHAAVRFRATFDSADIAEDLVE